MLDTAGVPTPPREERTSRSNLAETLLVFVLVVVLCNLALTSWLMVRVLQQPGSKPEAAPVADKPLPPTVDLAERERILTVFTKHFNNRDLDSFYEWLDPVARVQVSKEEFGKQLQKLAMFGTIDRGVYSNYVYAGSEGSVDNFQLVYRLRLVSPQFQVATLLVNLTSTKEGGHRIMGFNMNAN